MELKVKCMGGKAYSITAEKHETIEALKTRLESLTSIPPNKNRLVYKGRISKDHETLETLNVKEGDTLFILQGGPPKPAEAAPAPVATQAQTASAPAAGPQPSASATPAAPAQPTFPGGGFAGQAANPFAAFAGANPMGMMGGQAPDLNTLMALMQNPMMQQTVQSLLANPELMRTFVLNNPMLNSVAQQDPRLRQALANPEMLRMMMGGMGGMGGAFPGNAGGGLSGGAAPNTQAENPPAPDFAAIFSQLQGAASQGNASNAAQANTIPGGATTGGGLGGGLPGMMPGGPNMFQDIQNMMQDPQVRAEVERMVGMLRGGQNPLNELLSGGHGAAPAAGTASVPPTELYATQLSQLQDMGFVNRDANIEALRATGGNVDAAISHLLESGMGN